MIKFLLASHGDLADGICSSLRIIMGEKNNIITLCAYKEEDFDLKKEVDKIISNLLDYEKLIIITDIFGGSVNNEFITRLGRKNLYLISGLNLPLVIELLLIKNEENIEYMIQEALKVSSESIRYCNPILNLIEVDDDGF